MGTQTNLKAQMEAVTPGKTAQWAITGTGAMEASLNGNIEYDMRSDASTEGAITGGKAPAVVLENMALTTSLGTVIKYPIALNFGSILKNGVQPAANDSAWGTDGTAYASVLKTNKSSTGAAPAKLQYTLAAVACYDNTAEYAQSINYKDGEFTTKLEYATNLKNSRILRYDMTSDFTKTGKTFSIPDTAQFNSYVLKNTAGEYMGLVFTQIRK